MVWRNKLKVVREKTGGLKGIIKSRCTGLIYPPREGPARGIAPFTLVHGPRVLLFGINVLNMVA